MPEDRGTAHGRSHSPRCQLSMQPNATWPSPVRGQPCPGPTEGAGKGRSVQPQDVPSLLGHQATADPLWLRRVSMENNTKTSPCSGSGPGGGFPHSVGEEGPSRWSRPHRTRAGCGAGAQHCAAIPGSPRAVLQWQAAARLLQSTSGPFKAGRSDAKLGTASRLCCWTGLALCESSPHN